MNSIFPSTILISPSLETIDQTLSQLCYTLGHQITPNNPDIFIIKDDYSIAQIRQIKHFLSQKPYQHNTKIIIIYQAHLLHIESQNALLKALEEPGDNNYFFLTTPLSGALLPTIVSRCQLLHCGSAPSLTSSPPPSTLSLSIIDALNLDKTEILPLLNQWLLWYQQQLLLHPTPLLSQTIFRLLKSINMINANVDPKSALDYFVLSQS